MLVRLKVGILNTYGSQTEASIKLKISESRLSRIIRCRQDPSPEERERLKTALGVDYFSESEGPRAV